MTDNYPDETTWEITADCNGGVVVLSGGPYDEQATSNEHELLVNPSKYTVRVYDQYGDGICCDYGLGSFHATLDGVEILSGGQFGSSISGSLGSCGGDNNNDPPPPTGFTEIFAEGFESGFGKFTDGGSDASVRSEYARTGSYSLRIRDNSSTSNAYSDSYDVSSYSS